MTTLGWGCGSKITVSGDAFSFDLTGR